MIAGLFVALQVAAAPATTGTPQELVVCADPNNLPFSNAAGEGFENHIAQIIARRLHRTVRYVWWAQRRGYVRNTLNDARCDLWPGVASGVEMVATTRPYYRSTYMFVTRAARALSGLTLDDPRLKSLSIGIQMIGNDAQNTPPAHALASRGLVGNVHGYMIYGDYEQPNPPTEIVRAVAAGDVDVAIVWGPLAGWYARQQAVSLRLERVQPWLDGAQWPMVYDISMGIRRDEPALRAQVEEALEAERSSIAAVLTDFGVPSVADE